MALEDLMRLSSSKTFKKEGISEERIQAQLENVAKYVAFWREYPDIFVEFLCGKDNPNNFHLFVYQRLFLRAVMRNKYAYATFCRAFSKSFLSILILNIRCILYPGAHLFVTTGGKEQAVGIAREKVQELCKLIPGLKNEINWERGQSKESKTEAEYIFKNGSKLDIMAASQSSRGKRAHGGLMEECILIDQTLLNEVIVPTMNVDRRLGCGITVPEETLNKSQIYVTTAGWKASFAYEKQVELLIKQVMGESAIVLGGTYRIPVMEGLLSDSFVKELKMSGTFNEASFSREYNSEWSGSAEKAFFSADKFDKHRVLAQPEWEFSERSSKTAYYVLGIDIGRYKCTTEICVFKVTPQPQGTPLKTLVNLISIEGEDYAEQAIKIKKWFYKFRARYIAIDANGIGSAVVDELVKAQLDPDTGETLRAFGVYDGTSEEVKEPYKKVKGPDVENDVLFLIKATAPINTEAHTYVLSQMSSGKLKFLIDEGAAKLKLMSTKVGQQMDQSERAERLKPFQLTTILKEQMMNLAEEHEGVNIILKQVNNGTKKDKFSALEYGLLLIKREEDRKRKRKSSGIANMMFFS